ncbi:hypothetical protein T265_02033 [Opisthorchis viverrini]|uniref:Uncharacterized protein n=1 Tax=Opisthorchis viverrini TaxID=6198 RepID=A0A075A0N3_OPIVI|nr:hypothetical protein T265_02033 [Opisthorchis viverrini]KER31802.1 hypothetical protein T265_02033 [Opisthorchis viverrini]
MVRQAPNQRSFWCWTHSSMKVPFAKLRTRFLIGSLRIRAAKLWPLQAFNACCRRTIVHVERYRPIRNEAIGKRVIGRETGSSIEECVQHQKPLWLNHRLSKVTQAERWPNFDLVEGFESGHEKSASCGCDLSSRMRFASSSLCTSEIWEMSGVMVQWLEREVTDQKVRGSNPTSASRLLLSWLGQPGSIPALGWHGSCIPKGQLWGRLLKGKSQTNFYLEIIVVRESDISVDDDGLLLYNQKVHLIMVKVLE